MKRPKLITFDCYGTLIDWDREAQEVLRKFLERTSRFDLDASSLYQEWEEVEFRMVEGRYVDDAPHGEYRYKPYKEIMVEAMRTILKRHQLPLDGSERVLVDSISHWGPFADVKPALTELKKYARLGILSNIDNDIITESLKLIGIEFDVIVTAEEVKRYKPCLNHFCEVLNRTGLWNHDVMHVAFGFKYDIEPAKRLGIPCAWLRRGSPFEGQQVRGGYVIKPDFIVEDLYGIADIVKRSDSSGR